MIKRAVKYSTLGLFLFLSLFVLVNSQQRPRQQKKKAASDVPPPVPKMWDDKSLAILELPLADSKVKLVHASAEDYYRIPARTILKTYPVYAPGKEPPGYMEWLKQQEPQVAFDASQLKTTADWVKAGEVVFDAPLTRNQLTTPEELRDPAWYEKHAVPVAKDGTMPFYRYVIREKGQVQVGEFSCAMCHTRVMPDGSLIKGAQGNFPFDRVFSSAFGTRIPQQILHLLGRQLFSAPWIEADPHAKLTQMSVEEFANTYKAIPPGVITRFGSSVFYPPQVPDLIGVKDRRYLDHTGFVRHQSIEDLMRYMALVQGADLLDHFNDFSPLGRPPDYAKLARYSDEQLYAAALYLYSLKPPPNPNKFTAEAARGKRIFREEGCATCHTPPLYTNNKLTPVEGFTVPPEHLKKFDIMTRSVGTDPNLSLKTRRGTGYYKVPSLKGVWYRGPFEHNGSVATLEDWFDPRRLSDTYVPTGFVGAGVKTRAVKGHPFGLDLDERDRKALIAFLKTL